MHQTLVGLNSATRSLNAGFTTLAAMGSHGGGYADVELKRAIESGLVKGPRLLTAGPLIDVTGPGNNYYPLDFAPLSQDTVANGVDQIRAAVREHAHYGVDHIKVTTTGPFYFKSNGEMVNEALPSLEELKALVDEAHKRNLFVASHTYGGDGLKWAVQAGVDTSSTRSLRMKMTSRGSCRTKFPSPQPSSISGRMSPETSPSSRPTAAGD